MTDEVYSLQEIGEDEELLSFSSSPQEQAYIGHLRGDFGRGTEFWTTWRDYHEELKGQEFKDELDHLVNSLRESGPLKDLRSMERFCREHAQARMSPKAGTEYYGFRVDAPQHRYYLRFLPLRGNYNFYIYCYQTDKFERAAELPPREVEMSDKITTLVVEPEKPCQVREISGLSEMHAVVGGYIQVIYPFQDDIALVCNDEGESLGLPLNRPLTNDLGVPYDMIYGTFFLAGVGEKDFVSLTDDQIDHYKAFYDNMMLIAAEQSAAQEEFAPDAAMLDFAVACQISFHVTREEQASSAHADAFISHVTGIFNQDETLSDRTVGDLNFTFQDGCVDIRYTFASRSKDTASAEKFSEQCVRKVQDQLEGYGCKIVKIECFAEELEPDHMRGPAKEHGNQESKKKGIHHER